MGLFLLIIIGIWILWGVGHWLADRIKESIEDHAIKKSGVQEALSTASHDVCRRLEPEIRQARTSVMSFREMALERLPGLEDRIARHQRQQDYVRFVLPYKGKSTKKRRR